MASTTAKPINLLGVSARNYNAIRTRIENWTQSDHATPEQMVALGNWLVVEGEERQREAEE
jgi:hypothetical protein